MHFSAHKTVQFPQGVSAKSRLLPSNNKYHTPHFRLAQTTFFEKVLG